MKIKEITQDRFFRLTEGRLFQTDGREMEWWADPKERVLGLILLDNHDNDWSWVVLGRDENGDFRMIGGDTSLPEAEAKIRMHAKLVEYAASGRAVFRQGD